eukprot:jgi/Chrzof1/1257/Cz01g46170.t1
MTSMQTQHRHIGRQCTRQPGGQPTKSTYQQPFRSCHYFLRTSHRRLDAQAAQSSNSGDFGDSVRRIAKRIQGSLPIVGLLSRLASPEGGFDEVAYPEFCRAVFEKADDRFRFAAVDLEKTYGKMASTRWILLVLWMCQHGLGLVTAKDVMAAAKRLRITQDIEVELDRFEGARSAMLQKYSLMERPRASLQEQLRVAVDAIAVLSLGLKDGQQIGDTDAPLVTAIIQCAFPEAKEEQIVNSIQDRPNRATAYA